jgi:DNA mismatch endonuclease (patch repair protein)
MPGKPDIVLPKHQLVIFVHGCFWHSHSCRYGRVIPASRAEFWSTKRAETILRDQRKAAALEEMGWRVMTVWECETRDTQRLTSQLKDMLRTTHAAPATAGKVARRKSAANTG